ncbi:UDP-glucuronosyltransferase 2B31-like [Sergentomyia squamirostris]
MKVLTIFLLLPCFSLAANILVLENCASPSHHIWIKTLLTALAERGHNVTSITANSEQKSIPNLHFIHMEKVYDIIHEAYYANYGETINFQTEMNPFLQYYRYHGFCRNTLKGIVLSDGYKQLLTYPNDFKFDLIIYDYTIGPHLLGFVEKFGDPPLIGVSAFYSTSLTVPITGAVLTPSFVPSGFVYAETSTFVNRITNHLLVYLDYIVREYFLAPEVNNSIRKDFPQGSDVRDIQKRTKLILLNKDPAVDVIETVMPNVISVGGLQVQRTKSLPEDLQKIMDDAKNGVILFSLGTNVPCAQLGDARLTEIIEAFKALPRYTFLWKCEADTLPVAVPSNVVMRKFFPQSDVLNHPNIKLFITHCGLMSVQEAAWFGVPIIGLPIFADQFLNIKVSVKAGVAEEGDLSKIKRHELKALIEQIVTNPKYKENAIVRSKIIRDQKETPLERAVWWTEFVLRHPNMTFMRSPSLDQNFVVRHSWDVLFFFFTTIFVIVLIGLKMTLYGTAEATFYIVFLRRNPSHFGTLRRMCLLQVIPSSQASPRVREHYPSDG